jgi:hypothetical protein
MNVATRFVADDVKRVNLLPTRTGAASFEDVDPEASVSPFDGIHGQTATDWCPGWRAVFKMETSVVFGAFDLVADDESVCQVCIAVGTYTVGSVQLTMFITVKSKGLLTVVESYHIRMSKVCCRTNFQPAFGIGLRYRT